MKINPLVKFGNRINCSAPFANEDTKSTLTPFSRANLLELHLKNNGVDSIVLRDVGSKTNLPTVILYDGDTPHRSAFWTLVKRQVCSVIQMDLFYPKRGLTLE